MFRFKCMTRTLGFGAMLMMLVGVAQATAIPNFIDVALTQDASQSGQQLNGTSWSANVSPLQYTGNVWNDKTVVGGFMSASNLAYSDSTLGLSSIGFTLSGAQNSQGANGGTLKLLNGDAYSSGNMTLTITGLPTAPQYVGQQFDLYIAGASGTSQGGIFTLGAQTFSTDHSQATTWANGVNYVLFSNIALDGSGQAVVTIAPNSDLAILNGFQLEERVVSTPEPSTIVVSVTGLLGLLAYARRRRK